MALSQQPKRVLPAAVLIGLALAMLLIFKFFLENPANCEAGSTNALPRIQVLSSPSNLTASHAAEFVDADSCAMTVDSPILKEFQLAPKPTIPSDWPHGLLISRMCTFAQFATPQYNQTARLLASAPTFHRKLWEFVYIYNVLSSAGYLREGMTAMGFGCGVEPLPAAFAKQGVRVIATDLDPGDTKAQAWAATSQHTKSIEDLNARGICPDEQFKKLVTHEYQDMNHLPYDKYEGQLDFVWSSCAIEHVGSLELSKEFLINVMRLLKPGGISIHTTEFNLSHLDFTIETGGSIAYRKKDILEVIDEVRKLGYKPAPVDFRSGCSWVDNHVDFPPFSKEFHVKLLLQQTITSTSIALITIKS